MIILESPEKQEYFALAGKKKSLGTLYSQSVG